MKLRAVVFTVILGIVLSLIAARIMNADELPYKTYVPIAIKAPPTPVDPELPYFQHVANADYIGTYAHRLTACENHLMLRLKILVLDETGKPLNGIKVVRYTNTGDYAGHSYTGDKGPGLVEFTYEGPPLGGNWHAFIEMPGEISDVVWNLRTDIDRGEYCGEEQGNGLKHWSHDITFQRRG